MVNVRTIYLDYLVLLRLIDLASKTAARERVVDDEFVGFEARFFKEFRTWERKHREKAVRVHKDAKYELDKPSSTNLTTLSKTSSLNLNPKEPQTFFSHCDKRSVC